MTLKNMLIYYGWLNSFRSAQNSWNNEKVAQDLAKYDVLVFGDGLQTPTHGDYSNTQTILARIKVLNPSALIFGYVTLNQTLANFKTKCDDWNDLDIHGIFLDEYGYDFGSVATNGRVAANEKLDYVHSQSEANLCFANSWKWDHAMTEVNDTSYPNTTWNPDLIKTNLNQNDWYLLESFAIDSNEAYEGKVQWKDRGMAVDTSMINVAAVSIIGDGQTDGQDRFDFIYTSAQMFKLNAIGSSDTLYGASSAKSKMWDRPDMQNIAELNDPVLDGNIYYSYGRNGRLKLDFTSSNEDSAIEVY